MNVKTILFLVIILLSLNVPITWACHQGGALGMASKNPFSSTIDYTFASTFVFASTSGTLGCENWDFVRINQEEYIGENWNYIAEDAAQGNGTYLAAFAQMMGCSGKSEIEFRSIIQTNYGSLFTQSYLSDYERPHQFLGKIEELLKKERSPLCQV